MIWVRVYGGRGRSKQSSCNLTLKLGSAHTHTHTYQRNRMPDEKNIYLKRVHILENVVNICIINDLSYPPWVTRKYTSAQISTASLGCKVCQVEGICMCRLCEKDAFHTRSATGQPWNILTWFHIMRFGHTNYGSFTGGEWSKHIKYAQWDFFYFYIRLKYGRNTGKYLTWGLEW